MTLRLARDLSLASTVPWVSTLTLSSSRTFVFTGGYLRPGINTIKQSNGLTIGKMSLDVTVKQERVRVHHLVPHNHPGRAGGSIRCKSVLI